jgi:outer membrane receptor protein involved in Fe transport
MESIMRKVRVYVGVLLLALACGSSVAAQTVTTTTGSIVGTVTDPTRAVLPGVTVTATSPALMGAATTVTEPNGTYRLSALPPGEYRVTYELSGFGTLTRENVVIPAGFTATLNIEMSVGGLQESVTVAGGSPVVDLQSVTVGTNYDAQARENLPGARDSWALMAVTPAVNMSRVDVGGSGAWTQQGFQAYGVGGGERNMVEGILVNEGAGQMYYTDFSSFADVAVTTVGSGAEMPTAGVMTQFISKSGGNTFHGNVYFDYQNESMEAINIDDDQIAAGLSGSPTLDVRDLNRLDYFRDLTADVGGYMKKDRVWFYGAVRDNRVGVRFPTLIDDVQETWGPVFTGKVTANLNDRHKVIGYYQNATKEQPDYLGAILIGGGRNSSALMTADSVWHSGYPNHIWKGEYNGVLANNAFLQIVAGGMKSNWWRNSKATSPRIEDVGNNFVSGGVYGIDNKRFRPQMNGALTFVKDAYGTHNLKVGGEFMYETLTVPFRGFPDPRQAVSAFNNGVANQVRIYLAPNQSESGLWNNSAYINDSWQTNRRLTLTLGIRWDRNQPFLPEQTGPSGERYAAVDQVLVWNNWGPRLGLAFDLTGDARTVLKLNYGRFFGFPAADFASNANPNSSTWYRTYAWTDPNRNGVYDRGEEGALQAVSGGTLSAILDPNLENSWQHQASMFLERELAANFGIRTGFVWKGPRAPRAGWNPNRPYEAFNVPTAVRDPGIDGRAGTADDGETFTAYGLSPAALAAPIVTVTRHFDESKDNYYTWEVSATKRQSNRWSTNASFAHTWNREDALGAGTRNPNSLIGVDGDTVNSTRWQAKALSTFELPGSVRLISVVRHQSGTPFNRTFTARLNYSNSVTIRAEPANSRRTPNITVFDLRSEKVFRIGNRTLSGFFDVYNIFNTNAEQALTTASGASWLRPSAITPPRIARLGVKFNW